MASLTDPNALLTDRGPDLGHTASPAIQLTGVTRVFGAVPALVRAELRVERGETILVRGPNGAGKSTLLRVIATAISPTFGSGNVMGFDLGRDREEIRRLVELLGHRTRLYEDLSGRENLRFSCAMFGLDAAAVPLVLETVGLGESADERVRGYSQGMRQRVALGRLQLRQPELLLLDEPYAGLDDEGKDLVDRTVLDARRDGRTVVLATHDLTRGGIATRTVHMDAGRVISEARPPTDVPEQVAR